MRIRFWGVRGSVPTPGADHLRYGGNTACVEVRVDDGGPIVLDAGTGIRPLGEELVAGAEPAAAHVFLTHFHWDHIQGLPYFAPLYEADARVTIHGAGGPLGLRAVLTGQMVAPYFPVEFEDLPARTELRELGDGPVTVGAATLTSFEVNHPQGAHGFRIEAGARSIVFVPDVEPGDDTQEGVLRRALAGADVMIFDGHFTPEEYADRRGWGHGTWRDAALLAAKSRVGALYLFHHAPNHDDRCLERILAAARKTFEATHLATEGETVTVA